MSVDIGQLRQIAGLVEAAASLRDAAIALRTKFPQLRATVVDALDLREERPAFSVGQRHVYLVESDGHCWQLTREPARAVGVLLAEG
jgi:hypothetical protein